MNLRGVSLIGLQFLLQRVSRRSRPDWTWWWRRSWPSWSQEHQWIQVILRPDVSISRSF